MIADIGLNDSNDWTYELATNSDIDALKKDSPDLKLVLLMLLTSKAVKRQSTRRLHALVNLRFD